MSEELPGMLAVANGIVEQKWPHTTDAMVWAREFAKINPKAESIGLDEGMMLGWFANAIMAGYDTARARSTASETREAIIEQCARAIEPANHPLLMAATQTIRALKNAAQQVPPGVCPADDPNPEAKQRAGTTGVSLTRPITDTASASRERGEAVSVSDDRPGTGTPAVAAPEQPLDKNSSEAKPINMLLFCPRCQKQHIDAPKGEWKNPPHATHTCQHCGMLWRPSNENTNGVAGLAKHAERIAACFPSSAIQDSIADTYKAKVERDAATIKALRDKLDELCDRLDWKGPSRESNIAITVREARALITAHDRIAVGVAFITDTRLGGP